jgi:hypothetical protein
MLFTAVRHFPLQFLAFLIASVFSVSAGPPGGAGLKIKTIRRNTSAPVETNPRTEERILYFQGDRRRTEWKRASRNPLWPGGPEATFYEPHSALIEICEADAEKAFSLNLDNGTYAPVTLRQKLSTERLKAMQNRVSEAETPTRPTVLHEITTLDRGERKQAFGYTARHVTTTFKVTPQQGADVTPLESITDGWYIDLNTRVSCDPPGETPREGTTYSVVRLMVDTASSTNPASISASTPNLVQTRYVGKPETGFPISVKTTTRLSVSAQGRQTEQVSTTEIEVTDLSATNLDNSLFEVPPDFRIVAEILPTPRAALWARWLAQAHYSWVRFRQSR